MMRRVKRYILRLVCVMMLAVGATSCEGIDISFGNGNGNGNDDNNTQVDDISLTRCWHLVSFCDAPADVDIHINFAKNGTFTIYQRSKVLTYTIFTGTYTADVEHSLLSGIYDSGTKWTTDYIYTVDTEAQTLTLESVNNPDEVAVYEPSEIPTSATSSTKSASASDIKPL